MGVWVRRCAVLVALASAAITLVAPAAGAAGAGFTTASGGRVGVLPSGLTVYVRSGGEHPVALYAKTRYATGQVRDTGLPVRFGGQGGPRSFTRGTVVVRPAACDSPDHLAYAYPRTVYTGWAEVRLSAVIAVCPAAFRSAAVLRATMLAELARAVGLGTYDGTYEGRRQVLNATVQPQYDRYQSGDLNGLRHLAAVTRALAPMLVPTAGGLSAAPHTSGAIRLTGWALNGAEDDNPATVVIRRDGQPLATVEADRSSDAGRARASGKHMTTANDLAYTDPHPAPGVHEYCARLTDPRSLTVKTVSLGCVSSAPDVLSAAVLTMSGPDAGVLTFSGTAQLSGAPDVALSVTVMAGGLRRGEGSVDIATHTFAVPAAAFATGSYDYCVTVSGGPQTVVAGCTRVATG